MFFLESEKEKKYRLEVQRLRDLLKRERINLQ
jgi:hypothetical protein